MKPLKNIALGFGLVLGQASTSLTALLSGTASKLSMPRTGISVPESS